MRLLKASAVLALCLAIAGVAAYVCLRRSLPDIDGHVSVNGLSSSIDIVRDADAIPHVFASTVPDALLGLGHVHAQDRLWQMEFQRRIGHGRLSEIFGPATVSQDRFLRTVGFGRAARATWERLPEWTKVRVNAYVAGVNAFIATHQGSRLPPEFTLLRFAPEPWSGVDVVVWVKMMAWDLSANYSLELLRDDLVRAVGVERMQQLMPPYAQDGLSIVPGGIARNSGLALPAGSELPALPAHFFALALGAHPQRELTLMPRLGMAAGASHPTCPFCPIRPLRRTIGRPPRSSRLSHRRRHERVARLEQLGRRWDAQCHRQAAAGQRPALGYKAAVHLVPRAPVREGRRRREWSRWL